MKRRISWMLPFAFLCFCCAFMIKGTEAYAAMADEAEEYELETVYNGHFGENGGHNGYRDWRYFRFYVNEKSYVTLQASAYTDNFVCSIYNVNGKMVLNENDFTLKTNSVTNKSSGSQSRILPKGTYYLMAEGRNTDFSFFIQAEKQIKLPKGSIRSLKSKKRRQMTVTYNSAPNAIGYRIQYATNERFSKNKKTIYVAGTTKTISGLKKGTRYYVKICPYTVYDDGTRVFGQNSLVRTVVVKK